MRLRITLDKSPVRETPEIRRRFQVIQAEIVKKCYCVNMFSFVAVFRERVLIGTSFGQVPTIGFEISPKFWFYIFIRRIRLRSTLAIVGLPLAIFCIAPVLDVCDWHLYWNALRQISPFWGHKSWYAANLVFFCNFKIPIFFNFWFYWDLKFQNFVISIFFCNFSKNRGDSVIPIPNLKLAKSCTTQVKALKITSK